MTGVHRTEPSSSSTGPSTAIVAAAAVVFVAVLAAGLAVIALYPPDRRESLLQPVIPSVVLLAAAGAAYLRSKVTGAKLDAAAGKLDQVVDTTATVQAQTNGQLDERIRAVVSAELGDLDARVGLAVRNELAAAGVTGTAAAGGVVDPGPPTGGTGSD